MVVVSVFRTMEIARQARLGHSFQETPAEFANGGSEFSRITELTKCFYILKEIIKMTYSLQSN